MSKPHGTKEFWLAGLRAEATAFRAAAAAPQALCAQVPSCPGWTVETLVRHLGAEYGWVNSIVSSGDLTPPAGTADHSDAPTGADALHWWDERLGELLGTLDAADAGRPAWNPAPRPKQAEFWYRRMAHETAVHRWDAQIATGLTEPVESKLAADGVSEVLDMRLMAGRRRGPLDRYGVVALHATDLGEDWYVRLRGEAIALLDTGTLLDDPDHHERASAHGTASDLLLALYGRVPFDVLDVAGDASLLSALRTG